MVAIEQLLDIFSKVADSLHQRSDPPQQQPVTKLFIIPHKLRPNITKPIPSKQPNIIEDDDGKSSTSFQDNLHISPSGPNIILLKVPVPSTRVKPAQPVRVDIEGPSYNLISRGKKKSIPNCLLTAQLGQVREANAVTHQVSGLAQEYRHLVKVPDRKILEISFANELGKLSQGIRTVKGTNTVIFVPKTLVPKDKKSNMEKLCAKSNQKNRRENEPDLQWAETCWTSQGISALQLHQSPMQNMSSTVRYPLQGQGVYWTKSNIFT